MVSVKFFLKAKTAKRKSTIRTSISYGGNRILLCPGYSVSPAHRDNKNGLPKRLSGSSELKRLTTNLKDLDSKIHHLYDDLSQNGRKKIPATIFKDKISQLTHSEKSAGDEINKITILDFIDLTIRDTENGKRLKDDEFQIEEISIKPYRTLHSHFSNFQEKEGKIYLITDLNQELHDKFSDYLITELKLAKSLIQNIL